MASIIKKTIRGKPYYYARECKRVDGKPKIVWQKYLGKAEDIIDALTRSANQTAAPVAPLEAGAIIDEPKIALITESQLFGERAMQRRRCCPCSS